MAENERKKEEKKEDFTFEIRKKSETAGRQICFAVSLGNQKKRRRCKTGSGGFTLQKMKRPDQPFAFSISLVVEWSGTKGIKEISVPALRRASRSSGSNVSMV